jgi:hypothetical protein
VASVTPANIIIVNNSVTIKTVLNRIVTPVDTTMSTGVITITTRTTSVLIGGRHCLKLTSSPKKSPNISTAQPLR